MSVLHFRLEDEWVPESEVKRVKQVEIAQLPVRTKVQLYEQFVKSYRAPAATSPPPPPAPPAPPLRLLPARHCTSSRLLTNLIARQRRERSDCNATNMPMELADDERDRPAVSGARKRKLGRRLASHVR